jgi:AbrB family looped-hinge helix DNA binding protein
LPQMTDPVCSLAARDLFYGSVTVGERGQVVIPAELRKRYGMAPGDKLLVFRHPHMHGMVLVGLEEVEAMLGDLRTWLDVMAQAGREAATSAPPAKRKTKKGERG